MPDDEIPSDVSQLTREDAMRLIANKVYGATILIERLENAGLIGGNGHHARQELAQLAANMVKARWRGSETDSEP